MPARHAARGHGHEATVGFGVITEQARRRSRIAEFGCALDAGRHAAHVRGVRPRPFPSDPPSPFTRAHISRMATTGRAPIIIFDPMPSRETHTRGGVARARVGLGPLPSVFFDKSPEPEPTVEWSYIKRRGGDRDGA